MEKILIVDDTPENIDVLAGLLRDKYHIFVATSGKKALEIAASPSTRPDLILLDIMMPEMDGHEVCRRLKKDPLCRKVPIIFVTAKNEVKDEAEGFQVGGVDYITKPISPSILEARVATHLALHNQRADLENEVSKRTKELQETRIEVIYRLGLAAEFKDNETGLHVIRMSHYSRILAESIDLSLENVEEIFHASPMHDVGKIGIPDHILLKPGKLDAEEWRIMCKHPEMGAKIIGEHQPGVLETARIVALTHHEKWDGSGYPNGLCGNDIPLVGRIVAIADVFDALTTERPYKKAWPVEDSVTFLKDQSGSHFDSDLVRVFLSKLSEILDIRTKYAETVLFENS